MLFVARLVDVSLRSVVRATEDLDLLISKEIENQAKVKKAFQVLPDKAILELGDEDLAEWVVVRVNDEITVDLMTEASGISFEEAAPYIEWDTIAGVKIPFASAKLMLRFKQGLREKDVMDRQFLENRDED